MAIRSFQQIIDAHEAAQAMLRSLEVDVRDTLADAKAQLERFQCTKVLYEANQTPGWEAGNQFVYYTTEGALDSNMTEGNVYTLRRRPVGFDLGLGKTYPLEFTDDAGSTRVFYSFWEAQGAKRVH